MKPKFNIGNEVTWVGYDKCRYSGRINEIEAIPYQTNDDFGINMCYRVNTYRGIELIPEDILTLNQSLSCSTEDELKLTLERLGYMCIKLDE